MRNCKRRYNYCILLTIFISGVEESPCEPLFVVDGSKLSPKGISVVRGSKEGSLHKMSAKYLRRNHTKELMNADWPQIGLTGIKQWHCSHRILLVKSLLVRIKKEWGERGSSYRLGKASTLCRPQVSEGNLSTPRWVSPISSIFPPKTLATIMVATVGFIEVYHNWALKPTKIGDIRSFTVTQFRF